MARLNHVVGAILNNLSAAQDSAARHTAALAVDYGADPLLRHFPVPLTQLTEVEIDLRVIPKALEAHEPTRESAIARAKPYLETFAKSSSRQLLNAAVAAFGDARSLPRFPAVRADEIKASLESDEFAEYLEKAILADLLANRDEIVKPPAVIDTTAAGKAALSTVARVVLEHEDLRQFVDANPTFVTQSVDQISSVLREPLETLRKGFTSSAPFDEEEYDFDVVLDSASAREIPAYLVSTIRIRATRGGYRWVVTESGEPNELVQEA